MTEQTPPERLDPYGNLTVLSIKEEEGEGLIINWMGNYKSTLVDCVGAEKPVYDWIKSKFGDLKKAAGVSLNVVSEDGKLVGIGERGLYPTAVVEKQD